eukprot:CAMPEP_0114531222 /NCGR_PEP_ID=MMETSP0109-20121206/25932_1 /TAXON_ID=29199 /ORGANISM="Chlorarachnion reptans, Strain CCCM449" /LENGTH=83 /DNA_ID=CAMNT_0001714035 /DNA_START=507 /DNA_END=755 /DNA_ORIENTATION=+
MSEFGAMAANSWLLSVIFDSRDSKEERTVDLPPPYLSAATRDSSPRAVKRKRASARVPVRASAVVLANTSDKEVAGTGEEEEG